MTPDGGATVGLLPPFVDEALVVVVDFLVVVLMVVGWPPPEQGRHWLYHWLDTVQHAPEAHLVSPL